MLENRPNANGASYDIKKVFRTNDELTIEVSHPGGCETHSFDIVWDESTKASYPPEINLIISHDNKGDNCEAISTSIIKVNLYNLLLDKGIVDSSIVNIYNGTSEQVISTIPGDITKAPKECDTYATVRFYKEFCNEGSFYYFELDDGKLISTQESVLKGLGFDFKAGDRVKLSYEPFQISSAYIDSTLKIDELNPITCLAVLDIPKTESVVITCLSPLPPAPKCNQEATVKFYKEICNEGSFYYFELANGELVSASKKNLDALGLNLQAGQRVKLSVEDIKNSPYLDSDTIDFNIPPVTCAVVFDIPKTKRVYISCMTPIEIGSPCNQFFTVTETCIEGSWRSLVLTDALGKVYLPIDDVSGVNYTPKVGDRIKIGYKIADIDAKVNVTKPNAVEAVPVCFQAPQIDKKIIITCIEPPKKPINECRIEGVIKDMTGLDGCGLMIVAGGKSFEAVNLGDYNVKDGDKITFSYEKHNGFSICMAGEIIKLTCLTKQ